jgi:glycogen phosphorylase
VNQDTFLTLADFDAYLDAQAEVDSAFRAKEAWTRMSILNVARCGYFSSDRSVREYAEKIWKVPVPAR